MAKPFLTKLLNYGARKLTTSAKWFEDPLYRGLKKKGLSIRHLQTLNLPWLRQRKFRTIFDIGANVGEFAGAMELLFPGATIFSFEPLPQCYSALEQRMRNYPHFKGFNMGLAESSGEKSIFLSSSAPSSSFRPMAQLHKDAFPFSKGSQEVKVKIERLDDVMRTISYEGPTLIKIDVQGFEDQVIKGGLETVRRADTLIVETSFRTLYEGQPLFGDIYELVRDQGFQFVGIQDSLSDHRDGQVLQIDSVFEKLG
jgi:FkbM family methyltransferase